MRDSRPLNHVTVPREAAKILGDTLRGRPATIALANGCFDVFHAGHAALLEEAASLADVLVVAVNTDESIRAIKGSSRPIHTLVDRVRVLSSLWCVDYIIPFSEPTPQALIRELRPDVLIKGADVPYPIPGAADVESWGGRVHLVPIYHALSSTAAIAADEREWGIQ